MFIKYRKLAFIQSHQEAVQGWLLWCLSLLLQPIDKGGEVQAVDRTEIVVSHQRFQELLWYRDRLVQGEGCTSIRLLVFRLLRDFNDFRFWVEDIFHDGCFCKLGASYRDFFLQPLSNFRGSLLLSSRRGFRIRNSGSDMSWCPSAACSSCSGCLPWSATKPCPEPEKSAGDSFSWYMCWDLRSTSSSLLKVVSMKALMYRLPHWSWNQKVIGPLSMSWNTPVPSPNNLDCYTRPLSQQLHAASRAPDPDKQQAS